MFSLNGALRPFERVKRKHFCRVVLCFAFAFVRRHDGRLDGGPLALGFHHCIVLHKSTISMYVCGCGPRAVAGGAPARDSRPPHRARLSEGRSREQGARPSDSMSPLADGGERPGAPGTPCQAPLVPAGGPRAALLHLPAHLPEGVLELAAVAHDSLQVPQLPLGVAGGEAVEKLDVVVVRLAVPGARVGPAPLGIELV